MNLSDGEWKLMNRLWQGAPYTITRLTEALKPETGWSKHTVITMLARLEAKGAVRHEKGERAKRYYPEVERDAVSASETKNFLSKVYSGRLGGLVNAMVDQKALTKQEIDELYEILKRAEGERK